MAQERERRELERKRDYRLQIQQRNLGVRACVCAVGRLGMYVGMRAVHHHHPPDPAMHTPPTPKQTTTGARHGHHPPRRAQCVYLVVYAHALETCHDNAPDRYSFSIVSILIFPPRPNSRGGGHGHGGGRGCAGARGGRRGQGPSVSVRWTIDVGTNHRVKRRNPKRPTGPTRLTDEANPNPHDHMPT